MTHLPNQIDLALSDLTHFLSQQHRVQSLSRVAKQSNPIPTGPADRALSEAANRTYAATSVRPNFDFFFNILSITCTFSFPLYWVLISIENCSRIVCFLFDFDLHDAFMAIEELGAEIIAFVIEVCVFGAISEYIFVWVFSFSCC